METTDPNPQQPAAPGLQDGLSRRLRTLHEVTLELSRLETEEALFRQAIHLGRACLGFDRLGIWLLAPGGDAFVGTFGTDEAGGLRDERQRRVPVHEGYNLAALLESRQPVIVRSGLDLRGGGAVVGQGDVAVALLWDGDQALGYISTDNLLTHHPLTAADGEVLHLYAISLGHLLARLRDASTRRVMERRWSVLAAGLRGVLTAADELMSCPDLPTLYRRAVELGRERLGLERTSLYLASGDWVIGAFGTDLHGSTVDIRTWRAPKSDYWNLPPLRSRDEDPRWMRLEKEHVEWRDGEFHPVGHGWVAVTAIDPPTGRLGYFCNDGAITDAPFDENRQEVVALYASLLGTVVARKRAELRDGAFKRLGQQLNAAASPEEAARTVLGVADEVLGWDACWLELCDPGEGRRHTIVMMDLVHGERCDVPPSSPGMSNWTRKAIQDGPILILRQAAPVRLQGAFGDKERPSASIMVVPIRSGSRAIGGMSIQSYSSNAYNEDDLDTLQALADYCAGALERARAETERRRMEEQLIQAQRLEAIGRLAGGLAHDFNNMLAVINGYSELLLVDPSLPEKVRRSAQEIRAAGERSTALTRQLLAFSRKQIVAPRPLDLGAVLAVGEPVVRGVISERIALRVQVEPGLGKVHCDPGQIDQVLVALASHAADAMPDGGELTIQVRNAAVEAPRFGMPDSVPAGEYVVLEVRDTGRGFQPETAAHLFEPFFTPGEAQDGVGFGLAPVYGIVHQNEGFVEVETAPEAGTLFRLFLPRLLERPALPAASTEPQQKLVLVVEEEELLNGLIRRVLQAGGYAVLTATTGEAGVRLCRTHPGPIHLLLADVLLPPAGSALLARELEARYPDLPVVLMSGFTDAAILQRSPFQAKSLLPKPFSPTMLLEVVRGILDGVPTGV